MNGMLTMCTMVNVSATIPEVQQLFLLLSNKNEDCANSISKVLSHIPHSVVHIDRNNHRSNFNLLPPWSCWQPGSRSSSSLRGRVVSSSSRCRCGCRLRWTRRPQVGCRVPARPCSSGVPPWPAPRCGTGAWGSSPVGPALGAAPAVSHLPPPLPHGMHCAET